VWNRQNGRQKQIAPLRCGLTNKNQQQRQGQKQIPFGDDNEKGKCEGKDKSKRRGWAKS
jgi:hypothetical protein